MRTKLLKNLALMASADPSENPASVDCSTRSYKYPGPGSSSHSHWFYTGLIPWDSVELLLIYSKKEKIVTK